MPAGGWAWRLRDGGYPGRACRALRRRQEVETLTRLVQEMHLGRVPPLQQAERGVGRRQMIGPEIDAAGRGDGQGRALQLSVQEAERLNLRGLLELVPVDPILLVELAAPTRLPHAIADKPAVPEMRKGPADDPAGLEPHPRSANEGLHGADRLLDPACSFAEAGANVE
jgi:hypothetical protein